MLVFICMTTHKDSRKHGDRRAMNDRQAMLEASELPQPSVVDIDPEDPSQVLNDNEEEVEEIETPSETTMDAYAEGADDTGDLYGVHSPKAADLDLDKTADQE